MGLKPINAEWQAKLAAVESTLMVLARVGHGVDSEMGNIGVAFIGKPATWTVSYSHHKGVARGSGPTLAKALSAVQDALGRVS